MAVQPRRSFDIPNKYWWTPSQPFIGCISTLNRLKGLKRSSLPPSESQVELESLLWRFDSSQIPRNAYHGDTSASHSHVRHSRMHRRGRVCLGTSTVLSDTALYDYMPVCCAGSIQVILEMSARLCFMYYSSGPTKDVRLQQQPLWSFNPCAFLILPS